jgi:phage terminase large subunit GpA-like protein
LSYASAADLSRSIAELLRPPRRISVSEFARQSVKVSDGNTWDYWDPDITPYMPEIMDLLTSRQHEAVILAKPARTGGSVGLLDCWIGHSAACNPGDMAIYFTDEKTSQDYGRANVIRMHKESPDLNVMLSRHGHDNNITTTKYRHGMLLRLLYPTSANLSRITLKSVAITEYDSMRDSGEEGSIYIRAKKRVQNAMSAGMIAVESQPKRVQKDPRWRPSTPHEAPPTEGSSILGLYNQGDRCLWYWRCLHCAGRFPVPPLPDYDDLPDIEAAAATARVICPHCGGIHAPTDKRDLNLSGRWIPEWYVIAAGPADQLRDIPDSFEPRGKMASFWLLGCAATYQTWGALVANYLTALRKFEATGDETDLAATINTDQGLPYLPRALRSSRSSSDLMERAERETFDRGMVPPGARFALSTIDVQASPPRFEVQVMAYGVGRECWIIDRYAIHLSATRKNANNEPEPINPATYAEDWRVLVDRVLSSVYRDEQGREYPVRALAVDSGGKAGVTTKAYEFWRWCRKNGHGRRVALIKGDGNASDNKARVTVTFPDSNRKDRNAGGRGEVPVYLLNSLLLGDDLDGDLNRTEPGPRYIHYAKWLGEDVIEQLASMVRTPKKWERVSHGAANETWILLVYASALLIKLGVEKWGEHWENAPEWAQMRDNALSGKRISQSGSGIYIPT